MNVLVILSCTCFYYRFNLHNTYYKKLCVLLRGSPFRIETPLEMKASDKKVRKAIRFFTDF